ncbi:MAG: N-acetylglucosamine-6-phosphate deacetylase [Atopobiaceae bacterium]|nr:N-acetylglucosamine-6-phosphate deacetylase [Atopobiaceae bacterium]
MSAYYVKADKFVLPASVVGPGYLAIADGAFGQVVPTVPEGATVVDRTGCWVAPGYVDTHIHGFFGTDVMYCDPEGLNAASLELARHGTTSWTPTTLTASLDQTEEACAAVLAADESRGDDFVGARIQGIFLEGPFFTEKYKGAQNKAYMLDPSVKAFNRWQEAAAGLICRSALAPERDRSLEYIAALAEMGVATALGHSDATFEQGLAAVAAGANSFVHTYNAMSPLHHRNPGLVGCAMVTPTTTSELICDGKHVSPGAAQALIRAKGWEHVALITDCLACGGMPDGEYVLGELPIVLYDGAAHLRDEGNLAGSVLTLDRAVRNVVDWNIVTAEQAIRMATEVPARMSLIEDVCGSILPGRVADFNVLEADLTLRETYMGGLLVK